MQDKRLYLHTNIFPQRQCKQISTNVCKDVCIVEEIYADCHVMHTKLIIPSLWNCTLKKKKNIYIYIYFDCRELILSSMNFVTYEILDRCPNDCEINCTTQFRPRMNSNEFRGVNIMALPDHSGFQVPRFKDQWESHRSVAQSRRLCNKQWEAN